MSDEKKNEWKCGCSKEPYQKEIDKAENWEVKKKEKLKEILDSENAPGCSYIKGEKHFVYPSKVLYDCSSFTYLGCPHDCGKIGKKLNGFMDELELEHECLVQADLKADNNQIKSNQIKSNQIKSNQIKSNQESGSNSKNYLPWILVGIGLVSLVGVLVYFLTKKNKEANK